MRNQARHTQQLEEARLCHGFSALSASLHGSLIFGDSQLLYILPLLKAYPDWPSIKYLTYLVDPAREARMFIRIRRGQQPKQIPMEEALEEIKELAGEHATALIVDGSRDELQSLARMANVPALSETLVRLHQNIQLRLQGEHVLIPYDPFEL